MKNTLLPLAVGLIAVFVAVKAVRDRNRLQSVLQSARDTARASASRADSMDVENEQLRKQVQLLKSLGVNEIELARLRADSTELKRLKTSPPKPAPVAVAPAAITAAQKPPGAEGAGFTVDGTVRLSFGNMAVSGGWKLPENKRGFVMVTPTKDASGSVMLETRLVAMPETAVATLGLRKLLVEGFAAERFLVRAAGQGAEMLRWLDEAEGVDVLSGPRLLTRSGADATIQVQGNPELGQKGIRVGFLPTVQADGATLDLGIKIRLQPDDATNEP